MEAVRLFYFFLILYFDINRLMNSAVFLPFPPLRPLDRMMTFFQGGGHGHGVGQGYEEHGHGGYGGHGGHYGGYNQGYYGGGHHHH